MAASLLQTQINRASRRLFVRTLLNTCNWCWAVGLVLTAVWFLVQPYLFTTEHDWIRWTVASGLMGLATAVAVVIAVLRAPSRLDVALMIDKKFGLKERVTTSLTLDPTSQASPAGQALMEDVTGHVANLDVATGFPLVAEESSWALAGKALLVPVTAALLAAVAIFYHPVFAQADPGNQEEQVKPEQIAEVKKDLQKIIKKPTEKADEKPRDKSPEMKKIEADLEKLLNKPAEKKEDLKDLAKSLTSMENELRNREKELAAKTQAMQQQLKRLDSMSKESNKDGPAKDLQKALAKGDFDKAQKEAENLAKALKENKLTEEQQKQLAKQIEDLKDKMAELKKQQEENIKKEKENLESLFRKGEIDEKTKKEMEKDLEKKAENLKDLQDLQQQLQQCQECMKNGDGQKAGDAMKKAAEKLEQMLGDKNDLQDLQQTLDDLKECQQCLGNGPPGNNPVPGAGRRPETKDGSHKSKDSKVDVNFDDQGRKQISDYVPGPTFKKKSSMDMASDVVQSSQESAEARESQKVDRAAKDIYKGYFENLRKDAEKNSPPTPKP